MKSISNEKIKTLLLKIKQTKKRDKTFPWKFENIKLHNEDDGLYVTVGNPSYLGETLIANIGDNYDEYGMDCLLVQEALEYLEPLLEEVQRLRTLNQSMSNTLSKF